MVDMRSRCVDDLKELSYEMEAVTSKVTSQWVLVLI